MTVINVRLSAKVERGFSVVPTRKSTIVELRNGIEYRNANWAQSRRRYTGKYGAWTRAMRDELLDFWEAADGPVCSFRFKDWNDYSVTGQSLGNAPSGTQAVQLFKTYTKGSRTKTRNITRPVASTVVVYQNGIPKAGTVDDATGLFTPTTSWSAGQPLTWTGEFDVLVRFADDEIEFVLPDREIAEVNVMLREVVGE
jgi:uncharacterized protein (TIGR02217 family)